MLLHSTMVILAGAAVGTTVLAMPSRLRSDGTVLGPSRLTFSAHQDGTAQYDTTRYASFGNEGAINSLSTAANQSQEVYFQQLASASGGATYGRLALDSSLSQCITAATTELDEMTAFTRSACKEPSDDAIKWQTFFVEGTKATDGFKVSSIVFDPNTDAAGQTPSSPRYQYSLFPQAHDPAAEVKAEQCRVTGSNDCPADWTFTLSFDGVLKR